MPKFHHPDWLRACQLVPNSAESWNWVQKVEIEWKKLKSWVQKLEIEVIDRKVTKAQQNKMAGSSGENDDILIQSLKENAMNKSTLQNTNNWVKSLEVFGCSKVSKSTHRRSWTKSLNSS